MYCINPSNIYISKIICPRNEIQINKLHFMFGALITMMNNIFTMKTRRKNLKKKEK